MLKSAILYPLGKHSTFDSIFGGDFNFNCFKCYRVLSPVGSPMIVCLAVLNKRGCDLLVVYFVVSYLC